MPHSEEQARVIIDVDLVRRLIEAQFPQYAALPLEAVQPGGWDNRTFRLGQELSVRLPSAARYAPQVEKEHRWLPRLASTLPLPIPIPLAVGKPAEGYPWHWSIYRWLEGQPATAGRIADPTAFARSIASFLTALHRIDAAGGPAAGNHNFHRGGHLAAYDVEARAALSTLTGKIDVASAADVWAAALSSEWRSRPLWVHGDMALGNLLVRGGELCAVIGFGGLAVGDPACDLVMAWTEFSGDSRTMFRTRLPFDDDTWKRARGWALWKALITIAEAGQDQLSRKRARVVVAEIIVDHRATTVG